MSFTPQTGLLVVTNISVSPPGVRMKSFTQTFVPEPSSLVLMASLGLSGCISSFAGRIRKRLSGQRASGFAEGEAPAEPLTQGIKVLDGR
jgi:hypothetical protein